MFVIKFDKEEVYDVMAGEVSADSEEVKVV